MHLLPGLEHALQHIEASRDGVLRVWLRLGCAPAEEAAEKGLQHVAGLLLRCGRGLAKDGAEAAAKDAAKAAIHALTKDSQCTGIFCLSRGAPLETLKNVAYPSALPIPVWEQGDLSSHPESVLSLSTFAKAFQNFIGINATPLGMKSEMLPLGPFVLQNLFLAESKKGAFFDMLYLETPMQSLCRSHGVPYLNGDTMLKEQAKKSFQLWTGDLPD